MNLFKQFFIEINFHCLLVWINSTFYLPWLNLQQRLQTPRLFFMQVLLLHLSQLRKTCFER